MSESALPAEALFDRDTDLYAETFCEACETSAAIEECGIDDDTEWLKATCDCGETTVHARVCPWPRDGMVRADGEWRFPEEAGEKRMSTQRETDAQVKWLIEAAQQDDELAQSRAISRKHYAHTRHRGYSFRKMAREGLRDPDVIAEVPER